MSPLTIAWSMCAAACIMLGLMHLLLGSGKERPRRVYLLSSLMAISAGVGAMIEVGQLHTESLATYRTLMIWQSYLLFFLLSSMVWFVYVYFGTARRWLAVGITVLWIGVVIANFLSPDSAVFSELTGLRRLPTYWGESFTVPVGAANPWRHLGDLASLLIVFYVIDASLRAWRKGDRRRALVVGGAIVFFILAAGIHTPLVDAGVVATPYMISFAFLAIVLAMSSELVNDAVSAGRLAEEVRANEERWRRFMENVNLAVVGVDASGRINYANSFLEKLCGYGSRQLIGRPAADFVAESGGRTVIKFLQRAVGDAPPPRTHVTVVGASDEARDLVWSTVGLSAADGSHAGFISIGEDVTERLRTQRELGRSQREMEHITRVGMLGELASALAHELNQPLAAILSNAQAAKRFLSAGSPDLDELREILDDIVRDDKRAGEVIHRLRAMLRKGEMRREILLIADVVRDVVALLEGEFMAHGKSLRTELEPHGPPVEAGRVEIQQAIMNLALNAMRAMADNPRRQSEVVIATAADGDHLRVSVADNGPGIAPAQLPHVFEPFFTTGSSGLGMGLPICRRIVEAHGGRIWAENLEGGGARFSFTLPAAKAVPAPARRPRHG